MLSTRKRFFYLLAVIPLYTSGQNVNRFHSKWLIPEKHTLAFKISIPEGNYLRLNKGHKYGNSFGFLGISAGVEYYIGDKYNINIDVGTLTDFMVPFPAPVDYMGSYQRSFAFYSDMQVGTDYKRFHIEAGLQYHRTYYYERETVELFPNYIDTLKYSKRQASVGLAFSTYFRITRTFNAGINYYPSFFAIDRDQFKTQYGHLLFLEMIFRIRTRTHALRNP